MALPIQQEFAEDSGPQIGTFDAAYDLAMMDTFVSGVARSGIDFLGIEGSLSQLEKTTSKVLSVEEANNLYPNVEKPFSQPINEAVAFQLNEEGKKRQLLQQKIADGPGGSFYKGAVNLGAGLVAHALDPVEFGVGAFAGMGIGKLGQIAAAGRFGQGAVATGQVLSKGGFIAEATEGILGNALLEPAMYAQSQEAQLDYTIQDAFVSIVGGGLAAPSAIYGIKAGFNQLRKISPNSFGLGQKASIGQLHDGKVPNVDSIKESYDELLYAEPPKDAIKGPVRSEYSFEQVDIPSIKQRPMYASPVQHGAMDTGTRVVGEYHGDGIYLTDNPNIANNAAVHSMEEAQSNVHEFNINELNLVDADLPNRELLDSLQLPTEVRDILYEVESIKDAQTYIRNAIDEGLLDDSDFDFFMTAIKDSGIEGLKFEDSAKGHNSLFVFKDSQAKMVESNKFDADVVSTPKLDQKKIDITKKNVQENLFDHDNALQNEFDKFESKNDFPIEERARAAEDSINTLTTMESQGLITDPDDISLLNQIKEDAKTNNELLDAAKEFAECMSMGAD
jgi:hypothetical protein